MKPLAGVSLVLMCVVGTGAATILWNLQRAATTERKLADQARQYRLLGDKGDANAQYELGQLYRLGRGLPQDDVEASFWYRKAADQGLAKAEFAIGDLFCYGEGVTQSYSNALIWYRKAADQDDVSAEYAMGLMNYYGAGLPQSNSRALAWYRKAAARGDMRAETDIGGMYQYGLGVPSDRDEADRWYRKAASHGSRYAQQALGLRLSPLKPWIAAAQALLAAVCLFLVSGLFLPRHPFHVKDARRLAFGGIPAFIGIAMYWFEHSRYCLFPSAWCGLAFQSATLFLGGVAMTLLITALQPRAGRALLIFSGILLVVADVALCAIARLNLQVILTHIWRLTAIDVTLLGMAITAAICIWREQKKPSKSAPEPPGKSGPIENAV